MTSYKQPQCCTRCGSDQPIGTRLIELNTVTPKLWNVATIWDGMMQWRTHKMRLSVPLCAPCMKAIKRMASVKSILRNIAIVLVLGTLLAVIISSNGTRDLQSLLAIGSFALVAFGLAVLLLLVRALIRVNLGSFDGIYFNFPNKTFQAAFAELNPDLVRHDVPQ